MGPDSAAGRISANRLAFDGIDLLTLAPRPPALRGKRIAMICGIKYSLDGDEHRPPDRQDAAR